LFLLAVRLYWGWQFMQTGWGKLSDINKVVGFFTDLGIPTPVLNAYFVSALELVAASFNFGTWLTTDSPCRWSPI
jgi:putative oxidoreductase